MKWELGQERHGVSYKARIKRVSINSFCWDLERLHDEEVDL